MQNKMRIFQLSLIASLISVGWTLPANGELSRRQAKTPGQGGSGFARFDAKGYPAGFWERLKADAPLYPYEKPSGSPMPAWRELVDEANKEIDDCWAEWVSMLL